MYSIKYLDQKDLKSFFNTEKEDTLEHAEGNNKDENEINETKGQFFDKINNISKPLAKLIRERGEKTTN